MSQFTLDEWIEKPPAVVFSALSDPTQAPHIMPNIKSMTQLTDGPVGVGTRFREVRVVNGKEAETDLDVVAYEAPVRYGVAAVQSGITVTYDYRLQPANGGTQLNLTCVVSAAGIKKLMLPIVAGIMKKEDGDHLQQLKTALEA